MKIWRTASGLVLIALMGAAVWWRVLPRNMAEEADPASEATIVVREVQLHPFSMAGFLHVGEKAYRCEYYPHPGWPLFSAATYQSESYVVTKVAIVWHQSSQAEVSIDGVEIFTCTRGEWQRSSKAKTMTRL